MGLKKSVGARTNSNIVGGAARHQTQALQQRTKLMSPGQEQNRVGSRHGDKIRRKASNIGGKDQQFQLPSINSHANLGINNRSVDSQRQGLNSLTNALNRRSQIVTGNQPMNN